MCETVHEMFLAVCRLLIGQIPECNVILEVLCTTQHLDIEEIHQIHTYHQRVLNRCSLVQGFIKTQNQILVIHIPYCLVMGMKENLTINIHYLIAMGHHNGSTSHETADLQSE